jgi:hypothetical protein
MTQKETTLAVWQSKPSGKSKQACPFHETGEKMNAYFGKWKNGSLGKAKDFQRKMSICNKVNLQPPDTEKKSTFKIAAEIRARKRKEKCGKQKSRLSYDD